MSLAGVAVQEPFIQGGTLPMPGVNVICPCGCGEYLQPYNYVRPLVCYETWQTVPKADQQLIMGFGASEAELTHACERVLALAELVQIRRAS